MFREKHDALLSQFDKVPLQLTFRTTPPPYGLDQSVEINSRLVIDRLTKSRTVCLQRACIARARSALPPRLVVVITSFRPGCSSTLLFSPLTPFTDRQTAACRLVRAVDKGKKA